MYVKRFICLVHFSDVFKIGRWVSVNEVPVPVDLLELKEQLPTFFLASRAENTQWQYKTVFNSFCNWCSLHNIIKTLPASDIHFSMYFIYLTNLGKSASTINEAYYGISWVHKLAWVLDPCRSDLVISVKGCAKRSVGRLTVKKNLLHLKF